MSNGQTPDMFIDAAQGAVMTLDEYIAHLERLRAEHGGSIKVQRWSGAKARHNASPPEVAYTMMRDVGRRLLVPQFWQAGFDPEAAKGPLVVRV